jgi:hypothetical protein
VVILQVSEDAYSRLPYSVPEDHVVAWTLEAIDFDTGRLKFSEVQMGRSIGD